MKSQKNIMGIFALLITAVSGSAHAALAEACFQTKEDYEVYQLIGFEKPTDPKFTHSMAPQYMKSFNAHMNAWKHGPAKIKKISLKHSATQANGVVTFDSTGSTTPSGQIDISWQNEWGSFRVPGYKYSHPAGKPGENVTMKLVIHDPVCDLFVSEPVTVTFK